MLTLRCTQRLLKRLRKKPIDAVPSTTALGDWYANYVILQRRHAVICCAERSLLPLVIAASPLSTLADRMHQGLGELLRHLGVPGRGIVRELDAMNDVVIAKTNNRSILGVLNDYVRMADSCDEPPHEMSLLLARTPIFAGSPDTVWPIHATLGLFTNPTSARARKAPR